MPNCRLSSAIHQGRAREGLHRFIQRHQITSGAGDRSTRCEPLGLPSSWLLQRPLPRVPLHRGSATDPRRRRRAATRPQQRRRSTQERIWWRRRRRCRPRHLEQAPVGEAPHPLAPPAPVRLVLVGRHPRRVHRPAWAAWLPRPAGVAKAPRPKVPSSTGTACFKRERVPPNSAARARSHSRGVRGLRTPDRRPVQRRLRHLLLEESWPSPSRPPPPQDRAVPRPHPIPHPHRHQHPRRPQHRPQLLRPSRSPHPLPLRHRRPPQGPRLPQRRARRQLRVQPPLEDVSSSLPRLLGIRTFRLHRWIPSQRE